MTNNSTQKSDTGWAWFSGHDEELMSCGPCATREETIEEARQDGLGEFQDEDGAWKVVVHVVEARQDPLRLADWIDSADRLLEFADERMSESDRANEYEEGPFFECTPEQEADLDRRIKRACNEWQTAHGLVFRCPSFSASSNHDHVVVPHPDDDEVA